MSDTQWRGAVRCLIAWGLAIALAACQSPASRTTVPTGPLVIEKQGSFFVGGQDKRSDTLSTLPAFAPQGTIVVDQMYVHYQVPVKAKDVSLILIHGCCLTGKSWETTPDGRMGWDEFFVRGGYPTYVIDQASRGRSAADPTAAVSIKMGKTPSQQMPAVFAAGREGAWKIFRFGAEYPNAYEGLQYPLDAQVEFWKQMVPDWAAALPVPNPTVPALAQLTRQVGKSVLISHSQSGIYPFQVASIDADRIAAIVSIEPGSCPAPDVDVRPFTRMPVLLLYGDYVDRSLDWWVPRFKACSAFVQAINAAGGHAQIVRLPDVGFQGNSHMLMQDRNSLQVAAWLTDWIERALAKP